MTRTVLSFALSHLKAIMSLGAVRTGDQEKEVILIHAWQKTSGEK